MTSEIRKVTEGTNTRVLLQMSKVCVECIKGKYCGNEKCLASFLHIAGQMEEAENSEGHRV